MKIEGKEFEATVTVKSGENGEISENLGLIPVKTFDQYVLSGMGIECKIDGKSHRGKVMFLGSDDGEVEIEVVNLKEIK